MDDFGDRIEILLVEDNPEDAELALRALRLEHVATNGVLWIRESEEALDYLLRRGRHAARTGEGPRLILLDLKMPKIDGMEVLRQLKAAESTRGIPVVMLTSSGEERDLQETYRLGANSYIVKPVDFAQFNQTLARAGEYWMQVNRTPV